MTLRDFQQTLVAKVHPADTGSAAQSLLGFESGGECWLVDLTDASEVLPVPALTEVPLTKPWFRGIANIRGTLYSVTDLAAFHGLEPTPIGSQTRLLLAGTRSGHPLGSNLALLMSNTQGLKAVATLEAVESATPARDSTAHPWRGESYRDAEGRTWTHLLLPVLLRASEFLDVAA